jgi:nucleoside-diphosphate-sugar epimerase
MPTDLNQKIYVAGHRGMVGSAIVRNLLTQRTAFFESEKQDRASLGADKNLPICTYRIYKRNGLE